MEEHLSSQESCCHANWIKSKQSSSSSIWNHDEFRNQKHLVLTLDFPSMKTLLKPLENLFEIEEEVTKRAQHPFKHVTT